MDSHILSSLILCPLLGALILAFLPSRVSREGAFFVAFCNFLLAIWMVLNWGRLAPGSHFHFETQIPATVGLAPSWHLGVDGMSLWMVMVTALLTPLCVLASWPQIQERAKGFYIGLLALEAALIGAFVSLDVLLFYIFFEATLIPSYILLLGWGSTGRNRAALKFVLFTLFGSLLMWVALIFLYSQSNFPDFDYDTLKSAANSLERNGALPTIMLVFSAFALAFAIKAPLFPLHTWLPGAYGEAPTGATVLFAGALSKLGAYGFIRFVLPFFPETTRAVAPFLAGLAVCGIVYGAFVAISQTDLKRMLAYSSLSHIGFVMLGIFTAALSQHGDIALTGATLQMANHALTTGALFLIAGMIYNRCGTYDLREMGGFASAMPRLTVLFWFALFASIGLPGLNGFVGEFLILQGTMAASFWLTAWAGTGVILGAIYMLQAFRVSFFGEIRASNRLLPDVSARETAILTILLALCVYAGVAPKEFLAPISADATPLAAQLQLDGTLRTALSK